MCTRNRTTYFQFLNIAASPLVGHDVTLMTSFDIPCNMCPVVASLLLAGICFILQHFFYEILRGLTDIFGEHCSGSSLNFSCSFRLTIYSSVFLEWIGFEVGMVNLPLLLNPVDM